jgi:hypothetical protein
MLAQVSAAANASNKPVVPNSGYNRKGSASSTENAKLDKQPSAYSGYSADQSAIASAPPVYIGFLDGPKRETDVDNGLSRSNRRKAIELSFRASRAMEDLQKGGLPIPHIQSEETRNLEGCRVDMSKVKLVAAKTVNESPFLIDRKTYKMQENIQEYQSLVAATYQSYEKSDTSSWDSSTSSMTSSESEDAASMPPPALVLPPRLEEALKAHESLKRNREKIKRSNKKRHRLALDNTKTRKSPKLRHTTMNDALEASNEAR